MYRQYGDFAQECGKFIIKERDIPRNWYNYLWNESYISFVSQAGVGQGFVQDALSNRIFNITERGMYIIDDGRHWGIIGMPVDEELDGYSCEHGLGYTCISVENNGIKSNVCFFVPSNDRCEVQYIKLENTDTKTHKMRLLTYNGHGMDGVYAPQGYNTGYAGFDKELCGIVYKGNKTFDGVAYKEYYGYTVMNEPVDGYDAARNAFVGVYDSLAFPKALKRGGLTNTDGCGEKLCAALQKDVILKPKETKVIILVCGVAFSRQEIAQTRLKYSTSRLCDKELEAVTRRFEDALSPVSINTPDNELNKMFTWIKHQSNMGSRWARVRSNGYRDMLSDTDCLAAFNPELALKRFERILTYQYSNGYSPRNILNGSINDNKFSDNTVWITFTAMSILKELGDVTILDRMIEFNDGSQGSLYEHIRRSVDFLYGFRGLNNLIKIWGGDWNDCMNTAGLEGKGVSVWLSLAWYRANKMFGEIALIYGKKDDYERALERGKEMQQIIENYGWDGEYYLDAYNDKGEKIGSHENKEGRIYLIPQIWAVLSGVSDCGREVIAMDSVEKYLSDPLGTKICEPAYTKYDDGIGIVTMKYPGIHENGGVYLHTIAWKIAADAILKRADKVEEDIETILPFRNKIVNSRAEPYIMCNSYFGVQTGYRYGTPGQSWRTAAGQWFQKALINYVYGIMPEMEGLKITPCLPPSWKRASITKIFRGCIYDIDFTNNGTNVKEIIVDGERITGDVIPVQHKKRVKVQVITC